MSAPNAVSAARALLWRVHGLAALWSAPFLVVAAITGLLYVPTPQVESWLLGSLTRVDPAALPLPLDQLVAAARDAAPRHELRHVVPPNEPGQVLRAVFDPLAAGNDAQPGSHTDHHRAGRGPVTVYVDPGNGRVLGRLHEMDRWGPWAKRLHSQLLLGESWRWMIEWAATCLLVLLGTGVALAWQTLRTGAFWRARGMRAAWRRWHVLIGGSALVISLAIVLTGLTWSRFAGTQVRELRNALGQAPPRMPTTLASTPPSPAGTTPLLGWQSAWSMARRHAPHGVSMQLTAPRVVAAAAGDGELSPTRVQLTHGVWRAASADPSQPFSRFELAWDAYSGRVLFQSGWKDLPVFAKATALGIPFHRGEYGTWNQAVLALFGVTVLGSTVTGCAMWWQRRLAAPFAYATSGAGRIGWRKAVWALLALGMAWLVPMLLMLALLCLATEIIARHKRRTLVESARG
jgi:uncharacterized iron-regulated membrane protein